jgi:hypothetical protein
LSENSIDYYIGTVNRIYNENYDGTLSYVPNETYGLRYSSDNIHNIPSFYMKGYVCSEMILNGARLLNSNDEYHLDILDGTLTFDDNEKDRKITLSFTYNEKTGVVNVNVVTMQHTYVDGTYKYICDVKNTDDETYNIEEQPTFNKNVEYTTFINNYKQFKYEESIVYNPNIDLKFYNSGTYNINILLLDQCNNVFSSTSNKKVTISTPHINTLFYTNNTNTNNSSDS